MIVELSIVAALGLVVGKLSNVLKSDSPASKKVAATDNAPVASSQEMNEDEHEVSRVSRPFKSECFFKIPHIKKREPDQDDNIALAGERGESLLAKYVADHGSFFDCYWWLNKRIKERMGDGGANEVDLMLLTHNYVYLFESKYFSGMLIENPNSFDKKNKWIIFKKKYNTNNNVDSEDTVIEKSADLTRDLLAKVERLQARLSLVGVHLPLEKICHKVVFTNKYFVIEQGMEEKCDVISINSLKKLLSDDVASATESDRYIQALIRYVLILEENSPSGCQVPTLQKMSSSLLSNIDLVRYISGLPSWDELTFYGGKKVKGDLLKIRNIFMSNVSAAKLTKSVTVSFDVPRNRHVIEAELTAGQRFVASFFNHKNELIYQDGITVDNPRIKFHKSGSDRPEKYSVYEVEKIKIGGLYSPTEE